MKKFILGLTTLICCSTMAQGFEGNIKVGYDFFRGSTWLDKNNNTYYKYTRGFVIGLEALPFTFKNETIKLGVGVEYNFGTTNVKYKNEKMHKLTTMIPLYATAKFTYYRPKNIDLNLYTFARLGWAFATERPYNGNHHYGLQNTSGLYYGLGLGIDYKYFLAEILYDGKYSNELDTDEIPVSIHTHAPEHYYIIHNLHHKIGARLGLQLGSQHFKKAQIEPKIVEKIVEVPKIIEKKIIIKKFDISAEVLFDFNKYGLQDLRANGKKEIDEKVKELKASGFKVKEISVIGHTDRLGTDEYNYRLGQNRANTIKEYLKELGIKVEIKASSKGKTEPKVYCNISSTAKLKECLQPNRRVELQFLGFETQQTIEETI